MPILHLHGPRIHDLLIQNVLQMTTDNIGIYDFLILISHPDEIFAILNWLKSNIISSDLKFLFRFYPGSNFQMEI